LILSVFIGVHLRLKILKSSVLGETPTLLDTPPLARHLGKPAITVRNVYKDQGLTGGRGKGGGLAIAKDGVPVAMLWKPTGSAVTPPTGFAKRS
jgi:hypothetical protein